LSRFTNTTRRRASNTASDDLPTVQTHLLCVGRWLVSGRGQSDAQLWRIQNVRSGNLRRNRLSIKSLSVIVCAGDKLESVPRGTATIAFQYSFRNKVKTFIVLAQLQRNRPAQNGLGLGLVKGVSFFWDSPDNRCNTFTTWVQFSIRQ
jgi:hypothetical protein